MSALIGILGLATINVQSTQPGKVEMTITPTSVADSWWLEMSQDAADVLASNFQYLNGESTYEPILKGVRIGGQTVIEVETVGTAVVLVLRHGANTEFYPITLSQSSTLARALTEQGANVNPSNSMGIETGETNQ